MLILQEIFSAILFQWQLIARKPSVWENLLNSIGFANLVHYKYIHIQQLILEKRVNGVIGILNKVNDLIRIDKITYVSFATQISKVGGTIASIYGLISFVTNFVPRRGWETHILESVFDTAKPDKESIKVFKQRISYLGLYNLHE